MAKGLAMTQAGNSWMNVRTFSFLVLLIGLGCSGQVEASTIAVSGRQLLVNCTPFLMRGMNYSPAAIGQGPGAFDWYSNSALLAQDVAAMKAQGVNTVRVYLDYGAVWNNSGGDPNNDLSTNPTVVANVNAALSTFQANGIWVILNYWLPYNEALMSSPNPRQWEELKFQKLIRTFKTHPAVLMWVFGNENNASFNRTITAPQYFAFVQEAVAAAKAAEAPPQPISVVLVEAASDGTNLDHQNPAYLGAAPAVDLWGLNLYQSPAGYVTGIDGYTDSRPLFISEFGQDAWNSTTSAQDPASQASYYQDRWSNYIGPRLSALNGSNKLVGACAFEWNDEWYKDPAGTWGAHDYGGFAIPNDNDNYSNEEWYGMGTALAAGVAGPRSYRTAYTTLQGLWKAAPYNVDPAASCCPLCTPTRTATPTATPNPCAPATFCDFESLSVANNWGGSWGSAQQDNATYAVVALGSYSGGGLTYGFNTVGQWSVLYSSLGPSSDPAAASGAGAGAVDLSPYGQISFWVKTSAPGTYYFGVASNLDMGPGSAWYHAPFTATGAWTQVTLGLNAQTFINPGNNYGTWAQNVVAATQFTIIPPAGVATGVLSLDQVQLTRWCGVPTATMTPTPFGTPTVTPNPCLPQTIDDFESGTITNAWGGAWGQTQGTGSGSIAVGAGGQSGQGLSWSYNTTAGYAVAYTGLNPGADPAGNSGAGLGARDLSSYGQIRLWVKASVAGAYVFKVASNTTDSPAYAWYQATFNASIAWTQVTLNLDAATFSDPGGNTATWAQTLTRATQFVIQAPAPATATLQIDGLQMVAWCGLPSPTPSPSPQRSATPTASPTPPAAATATPSRTATPMANTPTSSPSATGSPTSTPSATRSVTPSSTPSPMATPSASATRTASASPSPSPSPTDSPVPPGSTDTDTPTITATFSASPTGTATPSPSSTGTPTDSPSATPTASPSATASPTRTPSPTATPSPSITVTDTVSPTASDSATVTVTGTVSATATATPTASPTAPATSTPSPAPTSTVSPTSAPSSPLPDGPARVARVLACPNPDPDSLAVQMDGPADELQVAVYTKALTLVRRLDLRVSLRQGWNTVPLDASALAGLPAGLYFASVRPWRRGHAGEAGPGAKLLLLR